MCKEYIYFLGLGSNVGDRRENINSAIDLMVRFNIEILRKAKIYETKPVGYLNQRDFLNTAIKIKTDLQPHELLKVTQLIEKNLKRKKVIVNGPRTVDIDILLCIYKGVQQEVCSEDLCIPHPRMQEREFVQKPLSEIR